MKCRHQHSLLMIGIALWVTACAIKPGPTHRAINYYDFGSPLRAIPCPVSVRIGRLDASPALQGTRMWYRYATNPLAPKAYAVSRWSAPPAELVRRHLQVALQANEGHEPLATLHMTVLRMELLVAAGADGALPTAHSVIEIEAQLTAADRQRRTTSFLLTEPAEPSPVGGAAAMVRSIDTWLVPLCQWLQR